MSAPEPAEAEVWEVPKESEGWGVIRPGDRKSHYYRETFSLCGKVGLYFGPLQPDEFPSPDDCATCRRQLSRKPRAES